MAAQASCPSTGWDGSQLLLEAVLSDAMSQGNEQTPLLHGLVVL